MKKMIWTFLMPACVAAVLTMGCAPVGPGDEAPNAADYHGPMSTEPATQAMNEAALTGDPDKMAQALALTATCHADHTCSHTAYTCTNPSNPVACGGTFCTGTCHRGPGCPSGPNCEYSQETGQLNESFDNCYLPGSSVVACTEYRHTTTASGCGCGGYGNF